MPRPRLITLITVTGSVVAATLAARGAWPELRSEVADVPTTRVTRADVMTDVHALGELRAPNAVMLSTPAVGGQMHILTLKATGTFVKAGDVVLTLDPSEQQYQLDEQESMLEEGEAEVTQVQADASAQQARDRADMIIARSKLARAELDVTGNELLSRIEASKRALTLEEARHRLTQLQTNIAFHTKVTDASMAAAVQKRDKARLMVADARNTIEQMTLRAPIDGVVSIQSNFEGAYYIEGVPTPEYRAGDTISSGRAVAEILDVAGLEAVARVAETDLSWIGQGQRALVTLNSDSDSDGSAPAGAAAARRPLDATVISIGEIRRAGSRETPSPTRMVDVRLRLAETPSWARPGFTARVVIKSDPLRHVLSLPRQAVFEREGEPHAYIRNGNGSFTLTRIKMSARTESTVVVQDLPEGTEVALSEPDASSSVSSRAWLPLNSSPGVPKAAPSQ